MDTLLECTEHGTDANKGNMVGIQPYMTIPDYASEETYFGKLDGYFAEAAQRGWFNARTIAVLPEYVATWLVVAGEWPSVLKARTTEGAMVGVILRNLGNFLRYFFIAKAKDRVKYAIFRMKADSVARIYHSTFSRLAKKYGVTIVAGSVVLPAVETHGATIRVVGEKLHNLTLVYQPSGIAYPKAVHKCYPTPAEMPFTEPGLEKDLPVYPTLAGRLGVLNCADSWYATTYQQLEGKIDFLAVPSYVDKDNDMGLPWRGNNIFPLPVEFDAKDFHRISYDDAWLKYAMPARIHTARIKSGMNVFLRGKFWNMGSDGRSILVHEGKLHRGTEGSSAVLQNLWLS